MTIRGYLISLMLIALSALPGSSQSPYRYSSAIRAWRLPYTGNYLKEANFGNNILEELARDFLRPPAFVDITVRFVEEISVQPGSSSPSEAVLGFTGFSLSGNLSYRGFAMDEVLLPSAFRFVLKRETKPDTAGSEVGEFEAALPAKMDGIVFRAPLPTFDTAVDTLIAGNFSFAYSDSCWQRFHSRTSLIDDYYASVALLDSLDIETRSWDMRDPEKIPLNFIRLSELVRIINLIGRRDFSGRLIREGEDRLHLFDKHLALYKVSRTCLFNLAEAVEKSGVITGFSGTDSLASYFMDRLMKYIRLGALMDDVQGRIYQDYLNDFYSDHVFERDADFIQSMLIRMYPYAGQDTLLNWASGRLMKAYGTKAKALIDENRYSDAVLLMENARSMASMNPYLNNRNGWEEMMSVGVNGIYNSYAGIASSSMEGGNVTFAREYLKKAEKYRERYPAYITNDTICRRVYRSIQQFQLEYRDTLADQGDYTQALDSLSPSIALVRIKKINALASAYYRQRQFSRAIQKFEQAGKIAAIYSFQTDAAADSVYRQSYKQWLLEQISQEQRFIWTNQPDSAGSFLTLAMETARSKGLAQDPDILKAISVYLTGISGRSCDMLEDSLAVFNIRAGSCFALRNFSRGAMILEHALIQAGRMASCRPDISALNDSLNKYKDAAEYQHHFEEACVTMVAGDYERGLELLSASEKDYTLKRIDYFGIPLTSVYDYVMNKANLNLSKQALEFYIRQGKPAEAFRYLLLLYVQGISPQQSYPYQEELGRSLALKDKLTNAMSDPKQLVLRYTDSSSRFNRFTEAYLKSWNQ